jgi:hypothetical protein
MVAVNPGQAARQSAALATTGAHAWADPRWEALRAEVRAEIDAICAGNPPPADESFPSTGHCARRVTIDLDSIEIPSICLREPGHDGDCAPPPAPEREPEPSSARRLDDGTVAAAGWKWSPDDLPTGFEVALTQLPTTTDQPVEETPAPATDEPAPTARKPRRPRANQANPSTDPAGEAAR